MALTLIKNKHGRVVSTTPERKKFLLDPKPMALKRNGQPKENANGDPIYLVKSQDEIGWTDVTPAEVKEFEQDIARGQEAAEEVEDATNAAKFATATAAKLSADASKAGAKALSKVAKKAQEEAKMKEEMEAKVRDAEGDKVKYDALSDDEKEMYVALGLEEVTA